MQAQPILETAMRKHLARSRGFSIVAFAIAGFALLLPLLFAVAELLSSSHQKYCDQYQAPESKDWLACLAKDGFTFDCDQASKDAEKNCKSAGGRDCLGVHMSVAKRCHDAVHSCEKSAVTQATKDKCASDARNSELFKFTLMTIPGLAIATVGLVMLRGRSKARRVLQRALEPGALARVEPYTLVISIHSLPVNEKIIFNLYFRDGTFVELSTLKSEMPAVLHALASQNPGCDFGELRPFLSSSPV